MEMLTANKITQRWAMAKDIGIIFGYKAPAKLLKGFRDFADNHPNYFSPYKPYLKQSGLDTTYEIICFAFYYENKDLLDAGSRSVKFNSQEIARLKEAYKEWINMNQVFVYTQLNGNKKFIGLFDLENIEEEVRITLSDKSMRNAEYRCYFIYNNETFELNI